MNRWLNVARNWSLAAVASATFLGGVFALSSCGGEGGPVGDGGGGGGDDSITRQFLALLPAGQAGATYVGPQKCGECHNRAEDPTYDHWSQTRHASVKVACEQCHGPGSNHAAAPSTNTILTYPKSMSPVVCGQCHGPLYKDYTSSAHAEIIIDPVEEAATVPGTFGRTSKCISCHSGLMKHRVDEGEDLGTMTDERIKEIAEETIDVVPQTASCATCHNPHAITGNKSIEGKEVQLVHQESNLDPTPILPASPSAVFTKYEQICAQCHNGRGANPSDATLTASTSRPNVHDSNQYNMLMGVSGVDPSGGSAVHETSHSTASGQCVHCHMPNSRHTFTVSFDKGCQPCHTAEDAAARANSAKSQTSQGLFALQSRLGAWAQAKFGDSRLWDYTSLLPTGVTPPNQAEIPIEVKRARHNYYYIVRDASMGVHNMTYTRLLLQVANQNLDAIAAPKPNVKRMSTSQIIPLLIGDRDRHRSSENLSG